MIKYKLICKDCEISFDSWFSSSVEFEKLKKKKLLICHFCNSMNIKKSYGGTSEINVKSMIKKYKKEIK